jgi:hypothetical protein
MDQHETRTTSRTGARHPEIPTCPPSTEVIVMRHANAAPRRTWHALTPEEKQQRLTDLRRRQQSDIELEVRRLQSR